MNAKRVTFALAVWLVAEAVLQIHGVQFWATHGGWQGWLWSPVLGLITVWFWLQPSTLIRWSCGLVASALLLVGPLWQLGAPLVEAAALRQADAQATVLQLQLLRNAETELSETQRTYLRNSETRAGWAPELAQVRELLQQARQQRAALLTAPPAQRTAWLSLAVIWIQLLTLVTLQVAAVAALGVIRNSRALASWPPDVPYRSVLHDFPRATDATFRATPTATQHPVQPATAAATQQPPATKRNTEALADKIAAGHYGPAPAVRHVMSAESLRHPEVKRAFDALIESGKLLRVKRGFQLTTSLTEQ